ncbi:hypothetical protein B0I31_105255 [Saccharothrix carnea]|uniref:Uncharacterized protein n=1 Tax=Saccharothrix carnea TaxID=1280637 RepID=A0A2P8I9Z8_SACCR|nr:hypothetical protein [Saccharothrix carnea]PSL55296.1 hypothetical protein B0I31_105255 [Saccharothrix carnea]
MSRVDQRVGTGASRVRRLLSRALLVVGGTLAGTAAAWALSASPAAAETTLVDPVAEVVPGSLSPRAAEGAVEAALAPVGATAVGQAVQDLDTALRTQRVPESSPPRLRGVAEDIRDTVGGVRGWFQHRASAPAPVDVVGGTVTQRVTETTPAAAAVPVPAGTPVVHGVFGKLSLAWLDEPRQPVTALPDTNGPSLPGDPSGLPSMPFAPLGAPVHCSCGGDGSGSSGGGNGPFSVVSADRIDSAVARALFPATERNTVVPGKQPGTTPD